MTVGCGWSTLYYDSTSRLLGSKLRNLAFKFVFNMGSLTISSLNISPALPPCQVWKISFWMRKHAAMTWKRTWVWSTSDIVKYLDLGPLTEQERVCDVKTTRTWTDPRTGKKKFQGNRNLKGTQYHGYSSNILLYYIMMLIGCINMFFIPGFVRCR